MFWNLNFTHLKFWPPFGMGSDQAEFDRLNMFPLTVRATMLAELIVNKVNIKLCFSLLAISSVLLISKRNVLRF